MCVSSFSDRGFRKATNHQDQEVLDDDLVENGEIDLAESVSDKYLLNIRLDS